MLRSVLYTCIVIGGGLLRGTSLTSANGAGGLQTSANGATAAAAANTDPSNTNPSNTKLATSTFKRSVSAARILSERLLRGQWSRGSKESSRDATLASPSPNRLGRSESSAFMQSGFFVAHRIHQIHESWQKTWQAIVDSRDSEHAKFVVEASFVPFAVLFAVTLIQRAWRFYKMQQVESSHELQSLKLDGHHRSAMIKIAQLSPPDAAATDAHESCADVDADIAVRSFSDVRMSARHIRSVGAERPAAHGSLSWWL